MDKYISGEKVDYTKLKKIKVKATDKVQIPGGYLYIEENGGFTIPGDVFYVFEDRLEPLQNSSYGRLVEEINDNSQGD